MNRIKLSIEHIAQNNFFKYLAVGGFCAFQNIVLLYFFTTILKINYLISTMILMATVNSLGFYLNRKFTFKKKGNNNMFLRELFKYHCAMSIASLIILISMYFLVEICKIWYLYANIAVTVGITFFNFFIHKKWTFK